MDITDPPYELDRARAEIASLRTELALEKSENDKVIGLLDKARAATRQNAEEIARLMAALEDIADSYTHPRWCRPADTLRQVARAALACRPQEKSHGA